MFVCQYIRQRILHKVFPYFLIELFLSLSLSIVMTMCSTALGLVMMPLLLLVYSLGFQNLVGHVPFIWITLTLILILVPCGIGILINYRVPQYSKIIIQVCVNSCMDTLTISRL